MKRIALLLSLIAVLVGCAEETEGSDPVVEAEIEEQDIEGTDENEASETEQTNNENEEELDENIGEETEGEDELEERERDVDAEPRSTDTGVIPQFIERQAGINADNDEIYSILDSYYEYNPEYDEYLVFSYQLMYLQSEDEIRPVMMLENYWSVALTNLHVELTVETTEGDVLIDGEEIFFSYEEFGVIEPGQAIPYYPAIAADQEVIDILEAIHENPQIFRCTYTVLYRDEIEPEEEYVESGYESTSETTDILRPLEDASYELISAR